MRQRPLHDALRAFAEEAAWQLAADGEDGAGRLRISSSAQPAGALCLLAAQRTRSSC